MSDDISTWWSGLVMRAVVERTTEAALAWTEIKDLQSRLDAYTTLVTVNPGTVSEDVNVLRELLRKSMYLTRKESDLRIAAELKRSKYEEALIASNRLLAEERDAAVLRLGKIYSLLTKRHASVSPEAGMDIIIATLKQAIELSSPAVEIACSGGSDEQA